MNRYPTDFAQYISGFLNKYIPEVKNCSPHTHESYYTTITQLVLFMRDQYGIPAEKLCLENITHTAVEEFLLYLEQERKCSTATRNLRLAAIHSFCRYLQYESPHMMDEWQRILRIPFKKHIQQSIPFTNAEGMKLLLSLPCQQTSQGRRDLALLSLLYDTAARVQELCDMTPASIHFEKPPYVRIQGKGNKAHLVPVSDEQLHLLKLYIKEHGFDAPSARHMPLFPNPWGRKLTRHGVAKILKKYVDIARRKHPELIPERFTCHCIRHTAAMIMLQAGVNLVYIRDILGHKSIQTTQIYAKADGKAKREALEKAYASVRPDSLEEMVWQKDTKLLKWLMEFS